MKYKLNQWEQQIEDEFQRAQQTPGTAEYLSTLLTGPDHTCPHANKEKTRGTPKRLGFFRATDGSTTYLDTDKVCQSCYDAAVPEGFNVWSTAYNPSTRPMTPKSQARFNNEGGDKLNNWAALNVPDFYPPMWQAGTEDDFDSVPVTDKHMPTNAEVKELWRALVTAGQPFYIDQLHLSEPWNPRAPDQKAEDARVSRENHLAYANAARGFIATGIGGAGCNTIIEQRVLGERAVEIPARFGENWKMATHDESEVPDASESSPHPPRVRSL
ncbi:uncharacterized protein Z518_00056 [Rhinocladiella mackenziei CBS 650.93]|uniref:Uncharacterized protein n=1 Tax=Rhinocladiella mackenziei CBS 650.93 TaxID=1442369 RepID=A0A0D2HEH8_9EURO|nr:uncharacterized protein Z518_00056 [Rhinocladiella mackenziei CBS 650.93]KIX08978.1 hypothetical protein Z518_00056 [Rhinocladiella mackenziei CBS 650.93]